MVFAVQHDEVQPGAQMRAPTCDYAKHPWRFPCVAGLRDGPPCEWRSGRATASTPSTHTQPSHSAARVQRPDALSYRHSSIRGPAAPRQRLLAPAKSRVGRHAPHGGAAGLPTSRAPPPSLLAGEEFRPMGVVHRHTLPSRRYYSNAPAVHSWCGTRQCLSTKCFRIG